CARQNLESSSYDYW
nr:immunoglobulin heavy chain junction region [Macaca mulatta]MOX91814.1 immunoglobulin heavy chain junction region [Macaca mulatta]MOX91817.1 immunoglobulin heavy chain junction region [Macaca mulatta]MOX91925.1 immunoglobulin heavy chain junction region [Macaca mulatta]MOX92047.1 immunoglobulin heavy chain junction region [Macaca mulatta]